VAGNEARNMAVNMAVKNKKICGRGFAKTLAQ
jgi:hypothetical protein